MIKLYKPTYEYGEPVTVSAKPTDVVRTQATDDAPVKSMKGNTVKWNQLVSNGDFSDGTTGWKEAGTHGVAISVPSANTLLLTTVANTDRVRSTSNSFIVNHKYYYSCNCKCEDANVIINIWFGKLGGQNNVIGAGKIANGDWQKISLVGILPDTNDPRVIFGYSSGGSGYAHNIYFRNIQLFDLTAMGIADQINSVADFETWLSTNVGLKDYYPYDAGSLLSVNTPSTVINDKEYPFPITTLKDINGNVMFPNGLCKAGYVKDEIDFEHGIAVKRVGSVNLGSLNWIKVELQNRYDFYNEETTPVYGRNNVTCVKYESSTFPKIQSSSEDNIICMSDQYNRVYIKDTAKHNNLNAAAFQQAMSGVMLYYELAEPITYHFDTHVDLKKRYVPGICNAKGSTEVVGAGYISNHEFDNLTSNGVVIFPDGMNRTGNTYDEIYKDGNDWKAVVRTQVTKSGDIVTGVTALAEPVTYTIDASSIDMRAVSEVRIGDTKVWENKDGYGIRWKYQDNGSDGYAAIIERIGNLESHKTLPIQSKMRRCIVGSDGSVRYVHPDNYLVDTNGDAIDYTVTEANGVTYDVMVEIPEYYFDAYTETIDNVTWNYLMLYPNCHVGKKVPKHYIGAFEAITKNNNNNPTLLFSGMKVNPSTLYDANGYVNLANVTYASDAATYRGGGRDSNTYSDSGTKTLLGRPATFKTISEFSNYARARGANDGYCLYNWEAHSSLLRLYYVEYANFDCQDDFNSALDSNGYHQGGLGLGVTYGSDVWQNYNNYNPIIPAGVTLRLGSQTGVVRTTLAAQYSDASYFNVPSYRGVENPFGHIWKLINGLYIYVNNNVNYVFTAVDGINTKTFNYKRSTSEPAAGYVRKTNNIGLTSGWLKTVKWDSDGQFMPATIDNTSDTGNTKVLDKYSPWKDFSYFTNTGDTGAKRAIVGGGLTSGVLAGFGCLNVAGTVGYAHPHSGSRLLKINEK